MADDLVVTIQRAAELLGGDKPISVSTVNRMIAAGVLVARGRGILRRVTMASILDYVNGVTEWQRDDAKGAPGSSPMIGRRNSTSRGRVTEHDPADFIPIRKPRPR